MIVTREEESSNRTNYSNWLHSSYQSIKIFNYQFYNVKLRGNHVALRNFQIIINDSMINYEVVF